MEKKEIYEHLAKIYLDASSKTKPKKKNSIKTLLWKNIILASLVIIIGLSLILFPFLFRSREGNSELALILQHEAVKLNFNFDPAKKEVYSLNLNRQNLSRFKALGFSARKLNPKENIALRIEFTNAFKEKSEVYVRDIPLRWNDYRLDLINFRNITDWSEMVNLSFIIEEWNAREKSGILYIDNIKLLM